MSGDGIFPVGDPSYDAVYAEEAAMIDASELIAHALQENGMSKTQLAAALGVSKSEISARVAGERNITVRKLAATLHALDAKLVLSAAGKSDERAEDSSPYRAWKAPEAEVNDLKSPVSAFPDSPYANWQIKAVAQ